MTATGEDPGFAPTEAIDPFSPLLARDARSPLREFNESGVLNAADVHVAMLLGALGALGGVARDGDVLLAAALAVRAPRIGHVFVDLSSIAQTASVESDEQLDLDALPWPEPERWVRRVAECAVLVAYGEGAEADAALRPLRLIGTRLYLDRYWREERQVAGDLRALDGAALRQVELPLLADGLARMFRGDGDQLQRVAAACAVLRSLAVVAGGPGPARRRRSRGSSRCCMSRRKPAGSHCRWSRWPRRPGRRRRGCRSPSTPRRRGSRSRRRCVMSCWRCARARCTGCWDGARAATAGSGMIAATACRTTS